MSPEIIYAIAFITVILLAILYTKLTGNKIPPKVKTAVHIFLTLILKAVTKTPGVKNLCFVKATTNPIPPPLAPPVYSGKITGTEIMALLKPLGIKMYGPVDKDYELTGIFEIERFLKHYHEELPYTKDDYDCDDHAWLMRAEALKWSKGRMPWGYVEGESIPDASPQFGPHAFNFVIDARKAVWFVDELNVAAGKDKPVVAYPIKSYMGRV
ncbi:hypothetical protein LCGC14_0970770 [marine sediment metagenome]|uniref:Uncharacterized protein n=1 Tax=marine sediment metagenome TaxID=412755 RepID=A0A0F9NBV0_9ZZZZ